MKHLFYILCAPLCFALISCDTDYSSYPPQFSDMVFETEAAVQTDTVTAGQTFHATLSMGTGQQNVGGPLCEWTFDKDIKPTTFSLVGNVLPSATFVVPADMDEGFHKVIVGLTYSVAGNETKKMENYNTLTGLEVKYTQSQPSVVSYYKFTCTKEIYVKAAPQIPEEYGGETNS